MMALPTIHLVRETTLTRDYTNNNNIFERRIRTLNDRSKNGESKTGVTTERKKLICNENN